MQIDLDKPLSAAKFAALIGASRQAVGAMLRDGTLSKGDSAGEMLASYIGHLREVAAGRADTPAAQHSRERILAAEAHRREELAALATIKRKQQAGELMRVDDSTALLTAAVLVAKGAIWSWQGTLPPHLVGLSTPEIGQVLEREARDLLEDMSASFDKPILRVIRWCKDNVPAGLWRDGGPLQP